MAVKNKTKAEHKPGADIIENPEALAEQLSRTEEFIEKNRFVVIGVAGAILLVVAGIFGFRYYKGSQNIQAQNEMFQAVYYFESDSLELALRGDGNNLGFVDIAEEYAITDAGNLANFYAGVAYLKQKKYKLAILYLEDFSSNDLLVQARAYSLVGDAHMELEDYASAIGYYEKAANHKPNKYFTPQYLMKAALAHEKLNANGEAIEVYQTIIDQYWESAEFQKAKKYKARLENSSAS